VSAVVPKRVTLTVLEQPVQLMLSAEDIERGYKDVAARYQVRHNDPNGYLLHLAPRIGLTRHVEVRGLGPQSSWATPILRSARHRSGACTISSWRSASCSIPRPDPAAMHCRFTSRPRRFDAQTQNVNVTTIVSL